MEGSESEAIFNSLNINPQRFINETLNTVDDLLDDAFAFYSQEASTLLKIDGTERSQDLTKGVNYIHNMLQSVLDKRLGMWEKYCLQHCFSVPEGFSLHKNEGLPGDSSICQDLLSDPDLDAQLASLREKLNAVGKESVELNQELQALERQSASSNQSAGVLKEALQLYEENSVHDMFQEIVRTVCELRTKTDKLRSKRVEDADHDRKERIFNPNKELFAMKHGKGLSDVKFEELQEFLADLKNT